MRLTEICEINGKKYIRVKGTKTLYVIEERNGAPASNAIVRLAAYEDAEEQGRLVILPCNVGDKVRNKITDCIFTIQTVELGHKAGTLFRCGNPGTDDYAAFYDFEVGEKFDILGREEAETAIAPPRAAQTPYWLRYRSPSDLPMYSIIPPQLGGQDDV